MVAVFYPSLLRPYSSCINMIKIRFKRARRRSKTCATFDKNRNEIIIKYNYKKCPYNEEQRAILLLNHEITHQVIDKVAGWEACKAWDNICDKVADYLRDVYC